MVIGLWEKQAIAMILKVNSSEVDMTRLEVILQSLNTLKEQYEEAKAAGELDEVDWWIDEVGMDLTDGIDCHPVFKGEPPCLWNERGLNKYPLTVEDKIKRVEACAECKAIWLMGEFE